MDYTQKKLQRRFIYFGGLLFTFHLAFASYINSSFVARLAGDQLVGSFFIVASTLTIFGMLVVPNLLKRLSFKSFLTVLATLNILLALLLSSGLPWPWLLLSGLALFFALGHIIKYLLDLYLEVYTDNEETGVVRGAFLTILNLSWLASPLIIGSLLGEGSNYALVYFVSGLSLFLFVLTVLITFAVPPHSEQKEVVAAISIGKVLRSLWQERSTHESDLHNILAINFILNFFYAFMVIYTPLYLHTNIGLSWSAIGVIFTIMLLPFVFLQYPLGKLADGQLGEKEILSAGLLIMGLACITLSFITSANMALWALVLFVSRLGAASVEIAQETYLFKKINADDTFILAISRILLPAAYIAGPLTATIFLFFLPIQYLFIFLGLIVLFGLRYALVLVDTK